MVLGIREALWVRLDQVVRSDCYRGIRELLYFPGVRDYRLVQVDLGFRDVLVHLYLRVDPAILMGLSHLVVLRTRCRGDQGGRESQVLLAVRWVRVCPGRLVHHRAHPVPVCRRLRTLLAVLEIHLVPGRQPNHHYLVFPTVREVRVFQRSLVVQRILLDRGCPGVLVHLVDPLLLAVLEVLAVRADQDVRALLLHPLPLVFQLARAVLPDRDYPGLQLRRVLLYCPVDLEVQQIPDVRRCPSLPVVQVRPCYPALLEVRCFPVFHLIRVDL